MVIAFSTSLRRERSRRGLTQAGAAQILGVKQGSYSRWESGRATPREEHHSLLTGFLGVTTDEIVDLVHPTHETGSIDALETAIAALRAEVEQLRDDLNRQRDKDG